MEQKKGYEWPQTLSTRGSHFLKSPPVRPRALQKKPCNLQVLARNKKFERRPLKGAHESAIFFLTASIPQQTDPCPRSRPKEHGAQLRPQTPQTRLFALNPPLPDRALRFIEADLKPPRPRIEVCLRRAIKFCSPIPKLRVDLVRPGSKTAIAFLE